MSQMSNDPSKKPDALRSPSGEAGTPELGNGADVSSEPSALQMPAFEPLLETLPSALRDQTRVDHSNVKTVPFPEGPVSDGASSRERLQDHIAGRFGDSKPPHALEPLKLRVLGPDGTANFEPPTPKLDAPSMEPTPVDADARDRDASGGKALVEMLGVQYPHPWCEVPLALKEHLRLERLVSESQTPAHGNASSEYCALVRGEQRFAHLLEASPIINVGGGISAHPVHTLIDTRFLAGIIEHLNESTAGKNPTVTEMHALRTAAVASYCARLDNEPAAPTFSGEVLRLVGRCFPNEPLAPTSYGRAYFETMMGNHVIPSFDEKGTLTSSYELLNTYVYTSKGSPIAIGGFYTHPDPDGTSSLWGARIAIDPRYQGGALIGRLIAHLGASAEQMIERAAASDTQLTRGVKVFTTNAPWNQRVINLYETLGFEATGFELEYNGLPEMVMALPDITAPKAQEYLSRLRRRFA